MSIYYTEKQQQPEFSMKDIISILGESADFDELYRGILNTNLEALAEVAEK